MMPASFTSVSASWLFNTLNFHASSTAMFMVLKLDTSRRALYPRTYHKQQKNDET